MAFEITEDLIETDMAGFKYGLDSGAKFAKSHSFKMYDDDGNLYYKGRNYFAEEYPSEAELIEPLNRFGVGAGCTVIKYHGKPEWTCG